MKSIKVIFVFAGMCFQSEAKESSKKLLHKKQGTTDIQVITQKFIDDVEAVEAEVEKLADSTADKKIEKFKKVSSFVIESCDHCKNLCDMQDVVV